MIEFWKTEENVCEAPNTFLVLMYIREMEVSIFPYWSDLITHRASHTNSRSVHSQLTANCSALPSPLPRLTNAKQDQYLGDHGGPPKPLSSKDLSSVLLFVVGQNVLLIPEDAVNSFAPEF